MLLNLRIRDFAIIDKVDIELTGGFTVVTGETGAGKSILVDALILALGGRANTSVIRTGAREAQAEALFDIGNHPLIRARLEQRELVGDDPNLLLVRRVIGPRGRGKVLINSHLSTVATLSEIVRGLVDISGQHEQQSLMVTENHLEILDQYGGLDQLRGDYRKAYANWRESFDAVAQHRQREDAQIQQMDFVRFQLEEIERLGPRSGEDEVLEQERLRLASAEKLAAGAQLAELLLYGEDGSVFDKLGKAIAEIDSITRIDQAIGVGLDSLESARTDIEEAARVLAQYAHRIEADPARLSEVEDRLIALKRLCRKHGCSLDEVIDKGEELAEQLDAFENADVHLVNLEQRLKDAARAVSLVGEKLSKKRKAAARRLAKAIEGELADMELAGARFVPHLATHSIGASDDEPVFGASGLDDLEFLWSANRGEKPRPLARIASGGELSRVMLAVKRVLCTQDLVSLYVFDEVDTGLGGKAADAIGKKIQVVAQGHQAIAITHLAPIAARADNHLRVTKVERDDRTVSLLEAVDGHARAEEIARMIDGASITDATRAAACDMLERCGPIAVSVGA